MQDIAFHNVVEFEPADGGGFHLRRFPREVSDALSPLGRMVAHESAGVELRFVTEAQNFRISLGCLPFILSPYEEHNHDVVILRGAFFHSMHRIESGRVNHINVVNIMGAEKFDEIKDFRAHAAGFSSCVWRVFLGRFPAIFYGLDTFGFDRRWPVAGEVPSVRWLAYGSSITNGASPTAHHNSYIYQAARRAGLDVLNQGLSGSCLCEPEIGPYLAGRTDWDVVTLELGVNMRNGFTPEQFAERSSRLVETVLARPNSRVILLSIFPNSATAGFTSQPDSRGARNEIAFNEILQNLAREHPEITLIPGHEILDDFSGLTVDLIHPSDYGHARMGANLGARLAALQLENKEPAPSRNPSA